jgi:hypothetical protein
MINQHTQMTNVTILLGDPSDMKDQHGQPSSVTNHEISCQKDALM